MKKKKRVSAELAAGSIVINVKDGTMLLVAEGEKWSIPVGNMEDGETDLKVTFRRESKEELAVRLSPKIVFGARYILSKTQKKPKHITLYLCEVNRREAAQIHFKEEDKEGEKWVKIFDAQKEKLDPLARFALKEYFQFLNYCRSQATERRGFYEEGVGCC